jgi:hypothetical protein
MMMMMMLMKIFSSSSSRIPLQRPISVDTLPEVIQASHDEVLDHDTEFDNAGELQCKKSTAKG